LGGGVVGGWGGGGGGGVGWWGGGCGGGWGGGWGGVLNATEERREEGEKGFRRESVAGKRDVHIGRGKKGGTSIAQLGNQVRNDAVDEKERFFKELQQWCRLCFRHPGGTKKPPKTKEEHIGRYG